VALQLWEEFLRSQGEDVPEGERSRVADEDLHRQLRRLAGPPLPRYQLIFC
jgi:hypothetical protein